MSDDTATDAEQPEQQAPAPEPDWKAEYDKLKAQARKWEDRAKENYKARQRLDEIEEASKTETQKQDDALARAEARAAAAVARQRIRANHPAMQQVVCCNQADIAALDHDAADIISGNAADVTAEGWQALAATGKPLWMHNCSTATVASSGDGRLGAAAIEGVIAYTAAAARTIAAVAPAWH